MEIQQSAGGTWLYRPDGLTAEAPVVFLIGENGADLEEQANRARKGGLNCALCGVPVRDWDGQLTPWPGPPVLGASDFSGGADGFLAELLALVPEVLKQSGCGRACVAGYSLAGLFALYAATRSSPFEGVAAMSPSVWYDGFVEYLEAHPPLNAGTRFYLSLGKSEEKARSRVLRTVGERLRRTREILSTAQEREVPLVMHDGGHYTRVPERIAAGVAWLARDGRLP
ncbi:MAG: alpha/beta hydrolase-fold protein [Clostridia bacterium]|nr:alpha/beta hydrolase-fold protein [Clostridia bacterium]